MTDYPDHIAIARKLLDQQGEINALQERLAAGEALAAAVLVVANQLTQAGIHDAAEQLGNAIDLYEEAPR